MVRPYVKGIIAEICLVCSEARTERYPFDVQHRSIIKYRLEAKADFASLQTKITERLKAILEKTQNLDRFEANSPIKNTEGLLQHEMIVLASIIENQQGPGASVSHFTLRGELDRLGYNNLALNIGLEGLLRQKMIHSDEDKDTDYGYTFQVYVVDPKGMDWILENYKRLNLRNSTQKSRRIPTTPNLDEDIPF